MPHSKMIVALLLAACGGISPYARAQRNDNQIDDGAIFRVPLARDQMDLVEPLILSLGDNMWKERVQATNALQEIGASALPLLQSAYCRTDDLEIRLRIEEIVQEFYERFYVFDQFGFLGITQGAFKTHDDHSRIPEGQIGIQIRDVHPDTAADESELKSGDIIYAINDEPIPESMQPAGDFGARIRELGPGTTITLSILRRGRPLRLNATLGRWPRELVNPRSGRPVFERLQTMHQRFPVWWARYFNPAACKRD